MSVAVVVRAVMLVQSGLVDGEPADTVDAPVDADAIEPEAVVGDESGILSDLLGVGVPGVDDIAGGLVEGLAEQLLAGFFSMVSEGLAGAATAMNELVFGLLTDSTTIDLGSLRGGGALGMTSAMGIGLVLAFFFASIIRALIRGEYSGIFRAALVDVPLAIVGTVGVVTVAQLLLSITDAATAALLGDAAASLGEGYVGVASTGAVAGPVVFPLLMGLLHLVYIVAALLTWMWLVLRSALIYFLVAAAPLGIATRAFPPAAVFARRTIEAGIALIVSKFFLALALSVGADAFAASTAEGELGGVLVATASMVLAAFMPSVVLKLVPIAEGATATAGAERAPLRMAAAAGGIALSVRALSGAGAASAGGVGATGAAGGSGPSGTAGAGGGPSPSGPSGPAGPNGGSGSNGAAGTAGASGGSGPSGTPGPAGSGGNDGTAGADGGVVETRSMSGAGIGTIAATNTAGSDRSGSLGDR